MNICVDQCTHRAQTRQNPIERRKLCTPIVTNRKVKSTLFSPFSARRRTDSVINLPHFYVSFLPFCWPIGCDQSPHSLVLSLSFSFFFSLLQSFRYKKHTIHADDDGDDIQYCCSSSPSSDTLSLVSIHLHIHHYLPVDLTFGKFDY